MLDAKRATEIAKKYLADIKNMYYHNISLEEIELTENKRHWLITLGYPKDHNISLFPGSSMKDYKIIKIDSENGDVIAMKIRNGE